MQQTRSPEAMSSQHVRLSLSPSPALLFLTSSGVLSFSFPLFPGSSLHAGSCRYSQAYLDALVTRDEIKSNEKSLPIVTEQSHRIRTLSF